MVAVAAAVDVGVARFALSRKIITDYEFADKQTKHQRPWRKRW